MRDRSSWHQPILKQLAGTWPAGLAGFQPGSLCDVELGLYLLEQVMPGRTAADAWTLFGGYPYGEALGDVRTGQQRLLIRRARHYLWPMRRRRVWRAALTGYLDVPQELRGYDLAGVDAMPERRAPARAASRFDVYEKLLAAPPAFARAPLPLAAAREYWFPQRDRRHAVNFTSGLAAGPSRPGTTSARHLQAGQQRWRLHGPSLTRPQRKWTPSRPASRTASSATGPCGWGGSSS